MNKAKFINNSNLKLIAVFLMIIDHIGAVLFPNIILLRCIGRLSFPIFAFCISEGYFYTKSRLKYLLKLLIFAIITEPIFDLALYNKLVFLTHQNVLFTFSIAVLFLILFEKLITIKKLKEITFFFPEILLLLIFILISIFSFCDYGYYGFILVVLFYLFRKHDELRYFIIVIFQSLALKEIELIAILSNIIIFFYNGKKGKNLKYFFYIIYPLHLLILFIIKKLIQ